MTSEYTWDMLEVIVPLLIEAGLDPEKMGRGEYEYDLRFIKGASGVFDHETKLIATIKDKDAD